MPCQEVLVTLLPRLFPGTDLTGLLELPPSLTALFVGGAAFDDAAAAVLGQLTQLKQLGLDWVPGFTDAGLEQLTNLDLAHLILHDAQVSEAIGPDEDGVVEFICSVKKVRDTHN
jgi:hypothetical protein